VRDSMTQPALNRSGITALVRKGIAATIIASSGRQLIKLYKPIDEADRIDDRLYLPRRFMPSCRPTPDRTALDAMIPGLSDK
jgi:hypothetical protein